MRNHLNLSISTEGDHRSSSKFNSETQCSAVLSPTDSVGNGSHFSQIDCSRPPKKYSQETFCISIANVQNIHRVRFTSHAMRIQQKTKKRIKHTKKLSKIDKDSVFSPKIKSYLDSTDTKCRIQFERQQFEQQTEFKNVFCISRKQITAVDTPHTRTHSLAHSVSHTLPLAAGRRSIRLTILVRTTNNISMCRTTNTDSLLHTHSARTHRNGVFRWIDVCERELLHNNITTKLFIYET